MLILNNRWVHLIHCTKEDNKSPEETMTCSKIWIGINISPSNILDQSCPYSKEFVVTFLKWFPRMQQNPSRPVCICPVLCSVGRQLWKHYILVRYMWATFASKRRFFSEYSEIQARIFYLVRNFQCPWLFISICTNCFFGLDSGIEFTGVCQCASLSSESWFKYATQHSWKQQVNMVLAELEQPKLSGDYP